MEKINLRYQVSLFGNYDEIVPNSENIKFFFDNFTNKGMMPYQTQEVSIDITSEESNYKNSHRLSLADLERKWNIKFNSDRIDIVFVNSNIGVTEMISKEDFLKETMFFLEKIDSKFTKSHKRVAFVTNHLFTPADISKSSKSFTNSIDYFDGKSILEWSNRVATRVKLLYGGQEDVVNVISAMRSIGQPMMIKNTHSFFQGLALNIDINTIPENETYRFRFQDLESMFNEMLRIDEIVEAQNIQKLD
jgi:hypothetical protein